jgi:hypothetical protein
MDLLMTGICNKERGHYISVMFFSQCFSSTEPVKRRGVHCKLLEFFSSLGAQGMINRTSMDMCIFTSANLIMLVKT